MPKVRKCRVSGCCSTGEVLRLFKFPKEINLAERWRQNMNILPTEHLPPANSFVCERHFTKESIGPKFLKPNAVPTLCLGKMSNPQNHFEPAKVKKVCCVSSCSSRDNKLYEFPKTEVARNEWAIACNLNVPLEKNIKLYICDRHFDKSHLSTKRILHEAFPELNLGDGDDNRSCASSQWVLPTVTKTYNGPLTEKRKEKTQSIEGNEEIAVCHLSFGDSSDDDDRKGNRDTENEICDHEHYAQVARAYQSRALKQDKLIGELRAEVALWKKKCITYNERTIVYGEDSSPHAITFARMILRTTRSYTEEERILAQNVNYMSAKAYNFMRDDLLFALPHKKTLLRWRPIRYVAPGIDKQVLENLEKLVKEMTVQERVCQIIFDEVAIKKDLTYNKTRDVIDGFVDNGQGHRESVIGNKASFFMLKGILSKWKYVLSYVVCKEGLKGNQLAELLEQYIGTAEAIGLSVKSLVCDRGSGNLALMRRLEITPEKPYFHLNGKKIYFLFDYVHLIKCVRNTLLKRDLETMDGTVSFKVIRKLYEIDQDNVNFKICPKLTRAHIDPGPFEKMSVSRATQVFSNSVAAGIGMAIKENLFGTDPHTNKCAEATRKFVKRMNDLFDEVDCKTLYNPNPLRRPILKNCNRKIQRLEEHIDFLKSIKKQSYVLCFDTFVQTINGMIGLSSDLFKEDESISFVMLGKINQDALENFFYKIRANLGANTNPSAYEMQFIVARLISMHILRRKFSKTGSNCEEDEDINLDWNITQEEEEIVNLEPAEQNVVEDIDLPDEHFTNVEKPGELQVKRYFTGYAIYNKVICKLRCEKCALMMISESANSLGQSSAALIVEKNFKDASELGLVNPEDKHFEVCRMQMSIYTEMFSQYAARIGIKDLILSAIQKKTEATNPEWYLEAGTCLDHRHKFLDFLITVLLYKNAKWVARQGNDFHRESVLSKNKFRMLNK